ADAPGRRQCRGLNAEAQQETTMVQEIAWIREPVALNVGTVGILRVGPEVIGFGKVVVPSARTTVARGSRNRNRMFLQITLGCCKDSSPVKRNDVELFRGFPPETVGPGQGTTRGNCQQKRTCSFAKIPSGIRRARI